MTEAENSTNGTLEQTDTGARLRFTRHLEHPPEKVWRAITEPEHLKAWFPNTIVLQDWAVGVKLRFEHTPGLAGDFDGEVLAFEPPRLLEFRWGPDIIRLEVEPEGKNTRLTLLDTINELGKAARDGAGWHTCLDRLEHHLDDIPAPWSTSERWRAVHLSYLDRFGPEASTIGPPPGTLD